MKKTIARWRKQPNERGLASVCQSPRGFELRENGEILLYVSSSRTGGWSWYGMGQNTHASPCETKEEARDQATAFYKASKGE